MNPEIKVTLEMQNLETTKSVVFVAVFENAETFLGDNRFRSVRIENPGKSSVSKEITLPKGKYGMAVFQDLNGNEKLDKNFIGIPTEPYAFSNNAAGRFGPPSWQDAVVTIEKNATLKFSF